MLQEFVLVPFHLTNEVNQYMTEEISIPKSPQFLDLRDFISPLHQGVRQVILEDEKAFSLGPIDLGYCKLVNHKIETEGAEPIKGTNIGGVITKMN